MAALLSINLENARFDPEGEFDRPGDIVHTAAMTRGQKLAALERWWQQVQQRIAATSEGMSPNGYSSEDLKLLDAIKAARVELTAPGEEEPRR